MHKLQRPFSLDWANLRKLDVHFCAESTSRRIHSHEKSPSLSHAEQLSDRSGLTRGITWCAGGLLGVTWGWNMGSPTCKRPAPNKTEIEADISVCERFTSVKCWSPEAFSKWLWNFQALRATPEIDVAWDCRKETNVGFHRKITSIVLSFLQVLKSYKSFQQGVSLIYSPVDWQVIGSNTLHSAC